MNNQEIKRKQWEGKGLVAYNGSWEIQGLSIHKWITRIKYHRAFSIRITRHTN